MEDLKAMIRDAKKIMAQIEYRVVKKEDIRAGIPLIMVDVRRLTRHGGIDRIGDNGTSLIMIDDRCFRPHPTIRGGVSVHFSHLEGEKSTPDSREISEFLLDEYDPRNPLSDTRFFVHNGNLK